MPNLVRQDAHENFLVVFARFKKTRPDVDQAILIDHRDGPISKTKVVVILFISRHRRQFLTKLVKGLHLLSEVGKFGGVEYRRFGLSEERLLDLLTH